MQRKQRLSASVDADVLAEVEAAVAKHRMTSISVWVNAALRLKLAHDRRLAALAAFVAAYESEHGAISHEEMTLAARGARGRATLVRGMRAGHALRRRERSTR